MGSPAPTVPIRPDDCQQLLLTSCITSAGDQAACVAICHAPGMFPCGMYQSFDRGGNINPRYCVYTFLSRVFLSFTPPATCNCLGTWTFAYCSDDPV